MNRLCAPLIASACLLLAAAAAAQPPAPSGPSPRQRLRMDADWRFHLDEAAAAGAPVTGWRWKTLEQAPGADVAAALVAPSNAQALGEDWLSAEAGADIFHGRQGFALLIATIPAAQSAIGGGTPPLIRFGGVDDNATVYLNGQLLVRHKGYGESFDVDAGAAWKKDGSNTLAVVVENTAGAGGISQPVTLHAAPAPATSEIAPGFDDKGWRTVQLPHDYVVEGPFDPQANGDHGFRPTPPAWYRKTFTLPADWEGKSVWIDFDGAFSDLHVWLNGQPLGSNRSGYIGARFDLGKLAKYGEPNVLAVHVDPSKFEGWWYEGGGLYRHVWLTAANKLHLKPGGTFVHPSFDEPGLDRNVRATVWKDFTLVNDSAETVPIEVDYEFIAPDGSIALEGALKDSGDIEPGKEIGSSSANYLQSVKLWDLEQPNLYRARLMVKRRGEVVDVDEVTFGFRTVRFDPKEGLFLNGQPVKIQGVCNHQDFAGVGVGLPDGLFEWRVKKLKEFGCNAWRTSHNPPAPELLDACDRLGMLVMDEARHLGDTYSGKTPSGAKADDLGDLEAMVRRDRNHPSIFLWSIENEEPLQGTPEGAEIARKMKERINSLDGTRPVTAAMNEGNLAADGITGVVDAEGFNYHPDRYDPFHAKFPRLPAYGSEITSAVTTRGEYARTAFKNGMGSFFGDPEKGYVASYDINAPSWAQTTEYAWKMLAERAFMAGGFVWTGFDYRGEPTPYVWPCVNSHFGFLDMCGFPKDDAFYYVAWWKQEPMAHVLPHWNWPADKGEVNVWVYSNGEEAELLLNGKSLGTKRVPRWSHLEWNVTYAPGKLEARSLRDGKVIASDTVETAGPAAGLELDGERTEILADREDIGLVAVRVVDAQGRPVPTADDPVSFEVSGPGAVAGTGNGDPTSHDPEQTKERRAFNGKCLALVRATAEPGDITVTASAPGLKPATITLHSEACEVKDAP